VPVDAAGLRRPDRLLRHWEDAFLPLQALWLPDATEIAIPPGTLALEGPGLVCSAVKPAEESAGVVLRCYNAGLEPVEGRWVFGTARKRATRVRADERGGDEASLTQAGRALGFQAAAGEWVTHIVG